MSTCKHSLFTPAHDFTYLREAWDSVKLQDHENYEWVIVPNGPRATEVQAFAAAHLADPRVRVIMDTTHSTNIGALKRFACEQCKGDSLVEFDYDDILVPGILSKLAKAFQSGVGFAYSDAAVFEPDLASWGYSPSHGWRHYPVDVYGRRYTATRCFELSPRMLCEVYYAPDHIRAWSRATYFTAGGHNPALSVGDDHDLICRTYLTGTPFVHVGGCGYLYRRHARNTVGQRGEQIQKQSHANKLKYLVALTREWCRRTKLPTLDLSELKKGGLWDGTSLPVIETGVQYGQITAGHVLQFLAPELQVPMMNHLYEHLAPGGFLHIEVPSTSGLYADMNPLHKTRFNRNSFLYFSRREFAQNQPGVSCRFDQVTCEDPVYPSPEYAKHQMACLRVDLCKLAEGYANPGPDCI